MNDDVDKQSESTEEPAQGPTCGERLAEARREQQISVTEIAKELHLDEPKVRALERNDFEILGAPVFAKGHLKKYAQLVNVDADEILVDYYKMTRAQSAPPLISTRPKPRKELSPGPWIAAIVVVVIAATAYWWFTQPPAPPVETPPQNLSPAEQEDTTPVPVDDGPTTTVDLPVSEPVASEPVASEPVASEPVSEPEVVEETSSPVIEAGQVRVLLTYTGDCWTEISDATGRRLFFALGKDGRTVELSGAEPLNVLFGSPLNVSLLVNGDDFALPADAAPGRPLRLTVSGL